MPATQTSFGLAAFVRCQHNICPGNFGSYCVSVSFNVTKGKASPFPNSPVQLALAAFNWFNFWLLPFSTITLPALELTTNACAFGGRSHLQCFGDSCHTWRRVLYMARRLWFGYNNFGL